FIIENLLIQEFQDNDDIRAPIFIIPEKFKHVDLQKVYHAEGMVEELKSIIKKVHPWSALHYGMTCLDIVLRLITNTIPEYFAKDIEIQVLTPQVRGTL